MPLGVVIAGPQNGAGPDPDFVVKDPEAFARNMAHVLEEVGKAASAWVGPRERGEIVEDMTGRVRVRSADGTELEVSDAGWEHLGS